MSRVFIYLAMLGWTAVHGQLRNKTWYCGGGPGLRFEFGGPVLLSSVLPYTLHIANMSDAQGNFLFVVTEANAYDSVFAIMPNGAGLSAPLGGPLHGLLAFPRPGSPELYDILARPHTGGPFFRYYPEHYVIDMSLNAGLGAVVPGSEHTLQDSVMDSNAGTVHANAQDYWYVTHERNSTNFLSYRITSAGLDTIPVVSPSMRSFPWATNSSGDLAIRPKQWAFNVEGDRLLTLGFYVQNGYESDTVPSVVEIYDFDQSTGGVTLDLTIAGCKHVRYGDWSPDGSKIYVVEDTLDGGASYQYDLGSADSATIVASRTLIAQWGFGQPKHQNYQQAPDGRIYIGRTGGFSGQYFMSCITDPNLPGTACGYVENHIDFSSLQAYPGMLPSMLKRYHDSDFPLPDTEANTAYATQLAVWPNPASGAAFVKLPMYSIVERLALLDASGRLVWQAKPSQFTIQPIDLSGLSPGSYVLNATGPAWSSTALVMVE